MVVAHPFGVTTGPNTTIRILLSSFPAPLLPRLALETLLATALDAAASPRQPPPTPRGHGRILCLGLHGSSFLVTRLLRRLVDHHIPTHHHRAQYYHQDPSLLLLLLSLPLSSPAPLSRPSLPPPSMLPPAAANSARPMDASSTSAFMAATFSSPTSFAASPAHPYPLLVFTQVPFPNSFLWTARIRGAALLLHSASSAVTHPIRLYAAMRRRWPPTPPLSFTFLALLKACAAVCSLAMGT